MLIIILNDTYIKREMSPYLIGECNKYFENIPFALTNAIGRKHIHCQSSPAK